MLTRSAFPRCKHCKVKFTPERVGQIVHADCVVPYMEAQIAKRQAKQRAEQKVKAKVEQAVFRKRKRAIRRLSEFRADAQKAFNAWVRARDADLPCVSCDETSLPMLPGGQWDAGHFLSRGAYPELALEPLNCWRQCKSCNAGSGKFAHKARTVAQKYEDELLNRIGPEKLAWLKGPHEATKYTREDYEEIEATYKAKLKELEATKENA